MIKVLHGSDEFRIDEEVKLLVAAGTADGDMEVQRMDAAASNAAALLQMMAQPSWSKRMLIVSGIAALAGGELDFTELPQRKDPDTVLVLVEHAPLPPSSPILRKLDGLAEIKSLPALTRRADLLAWINERLRHHGAAPRPGVAERLAELVGNNTRQLDSEIRKLLLYAEDEHIAKEDVDAMVPASAAARVFDLVDAVMARQEGRALQTLHKLLQSGESAFSLLNLLARQTRMLLITRHGLDRKMPQNQIAEQMKVRHQFIMDKLMRQARGITHRQAAAMHKRVHRADVDIKSGVAHERVALELLIAGLSRLKGAPVG